MNLVKSDLETECIYTSALFFLVLYEDRSLQEHSIDQDKRSVMLSLCKYTMIFIK